MGRADRLWASLPLRARFPEYIAVFCVGLGGGLLIGLLVGLIFDVPILTALGYTVFALGLFCLLGGGAQGGKYTSLGLGEGAGRVKFVYDEDPNVLANLSGARRPGRNPGAFWMVVGGFLYGAIGLAIAGLS
jgi:hypothetical protein